MVYLEAQYFGLPVMSSNKGGSREVITKESGYLINHHKEAVEILSKKKFKELNPKKIKENASRFSSDKSISSFLEIIMRNQRD